MAATVYRTEHTTLSSLQTTIKTTTNSSVNTTSAKTPNGDGDHRYYLIIGLVVVCYVLGVISLLYNVCCKKKKTKTKKKSGIVGDENKMLPQFSSQLTDMDLEARVKRQRALIDEMQSKKKPYGSLSWILAAASSGGALGNLPPSKGSGGILASKDINITMNASDIPPVLRNMGVRGIEPVKKDKAELSYGEALLANLRKTLTESEAEHGKRGSQPSPYGRKGPYGNKLPLNAERSGLTTL